MWSYDETGIELKTWVAWRLTRLRENKTKRRIKVSLLRINRDKKQSISITYKENLQILSWDPVDFTASVSYIGKGRSAIGLIKFVPAVVG